MKSIGLLFLIFLSHSSLAAEIKTEAGDSFSTYVNFWHSNDFSGNDLGYTGGLDLEVGRAYSDGWTYALRYYSALYSLRVIPYGNPDSPDYAVFTGWDNVPADMIALPAHTQNQRIEENSILSARVQYHAPTSHFTYSVEWGFTGTQSNYGLIPGFAGFQQALHRLLGATKMDIIADHRPTEFGMMIKPKLTGEFGLITRSPVSLALKSSITASADTEGRRTFLGGVIDFKLGLIENLSRAHELLQFESMVEGQASSTHKQAMFGEQVNLNFQNTTVFFSLNYMLTKTGYADFFKTDYIDNESTAKVGFLTWF